MNNQRNRWKDLKIITFEEFLLKHNTSNLYSKVGQELLKLSILETNQANIYLTDTDTHSAICSEAYNLEKTLYDLPQKHYY